MDAMEADWLGLCRRCAEGLKAMLEAYPSTLERAVGTGRGCGGDETLVIDREAEAIVFAELDAAHREGARFTVISEERGEVARGGGPVRVIVDPIDGSLNAKRGLGPHALSVAVADGPTMADVRFGYVYDFARGEEWSARHGTGALLDGKALPASPPERRSGDGRLELLAIESADPRLVAAAIDGLQAQAHRLRALGSVAVALCQVAAVRVDGLAALGWTRSVDAAAGQLVVRESGGVVSFSPGGAPLGVSLELDARYPLAAARTPEALERLVTLSLSQS